MSTLFDNTAFSSFFKFGLKTGVYKVTSGIMVVLTDSAAYPNLDYYELNQSVICQKLVGVCFVTMIMFKFFVGLNLHASVWNAELYTLLPLSGRMTNFITSTKKQPRPTADCY